VFERFVRESRRAVTCAQDEARALGAERVEPEHLLLALAGGCGDPAARAIDEAGLSREAIAAAIEQDLVAALEVVGVPASVVASVPARPGAGRPRLSLAARDTLERALRAAVRRGDRRIGTEHVLLGVLRPPVGTVARVLAGLEVEPERLAALVQLEIAADERRCA